jgi:predicted dehydrogenase/threonine dehydrogenase-like Zn-dependent dehydrogenase
MKQIIQNYRTGKIEVADVPVPLCSSKSMLIKNHASLISVGTERSIIELGKKSLLGKAKARPDLVRRFREKAKQEGLVKTFREALGRLDEPTQLGYSSSGVVVEVGDAIHKFSPGDRVACIGAGYASHAEYITIPENLCCKVPDSVTYEEASFGMLGIIALHGVRCANLAFGESVAVIGLGLLGLLTAGILKAYGCRVFGMDVDQDKVKYAKKYGIDNVFRYVDDLKNTIERFTDGYGTDTVIITATTKSSDPVQTAVDIARYNGRVVVVGVVDIHPQRNEMWHKQVDIIVSKAGGPGIFDPVYENRVIDYPIGHVRWSENRNLEEFLRLISEKKIDVSSLVTHRFKIEKAEAAYDEILEAKSGPYIGVVLEYPGKAKKTRTPKGEVKKAKTAQGLSVGVIGAGLFGQALLLPALKASLKGRDLRLHTLCTSSGESAYHTGKRYGFENYSTDYSEVLKNKNIDTVVVLTPHSTHSQIVIEALRACKNVFVEKPLCINEAELREIMGAYASLKKASSSVLAVGYNRRFSPHAQKIKEVVKGRHDPLVMIYRVNAGYVPPEHWVHQPEEGGSRIVGEVCHFVDFMQFVTGSDPVKVHAERISGNNRTSVNSDNASAVVKFSDGSLGNIVYTASGDRSFSRESVEIFFEGKVVVMRDFKETMIYYKGRKKNFKTANQQMGYKEELAHFFDLSLGRSSCMLTPHEIFYSTLVTFKIDESLSTGNPRDVYLEKA